MEGKIEGKNRNIKEDEEEDVSRYWMTSVKWEDAERLNRQEQIAVCGELVVEDAIFLRKTGYVNERMKVIVFNVRYEFLRKVTSEVVSEKYLARGNLKAIHPLT